MITFLTLLKHTSSTKLSHSNKIVDLHLDLVPKDVVLTYVHKDAVHKCPLEKFLRQVP